MGVSVSGCFVFEKRVCKAVQLDNIYGIGAECDNY